MMSVTLSTNVRKLPFTMSSIRVLPAGQRGDEEKAILPPSVLLLEERPREGIVAR
jgi:hypothetical protein